MGDNFISSIDITLSYYDKYGDYNEVEICNGDTILVTTKKKFFECVGDTMYFDDGSEIVISDIIFAENLTKNY